jgi:CRISPR/Cas system-associated exonuclease Cas4 (RecB family)
VISVQSPESIRSLIRSRPASPSKLGSFLECPLQFLLGTDRALSARLPPHPLALLGSAAHKVIEQATFGSRPSGIEVVNLVKQQFESLINSAPDCLLKWIYERDGIAGVLPASQITSAARLVYQSLPTEGRSAEYIDHRVWREESFSCTELDMAGWPDFVQQKGDSIHVVDYKLGLGRDNEDKPNPKYILQIAAYGLLAKKSTGVKNVTLELRAPADLWLGNLTDELEEKVQQVSNQLKKTVPRNKPLDPLQLSTPGEHCKKCSVRSSCSAYLQRLEKWTDKTDETLSPKDVAGMVLSVNLNREALNLVCASEARDTKITITGVVSALYAQSLSVGDDIKLFSLETTEILGRAEYVSNFHVWNSRNAKSSAFTFHIKP